MGYNNLKYEDCGVALTSYKRKGWPEKRLRFCLRLNPSKQEIRHFPKDTELSFVPMEAVGEDGTLDLSNTRLIEDVENGYTFFRNADVAIAKITPCFENGKGCIFRNLVHEYGFGTTELTVMRPRLLVPAFLYYLTISHHFRVTGIGLMQGSAGQKRVPDDYIRNYLIGLPSEAEQQAISAFLDRETARIDALISKKERMIELLKEKRIALITQAVTKGLDPNVPMKDSGIEWLGEVPEHWDIKRLKYVSSCNDESLPETTDPDYEMLYVDISSVSRIEGITTKEEMSFEDAPSRARRRVRDGDTIVSTVRTYLRAIAPIENAEDNLIVSTGFAVLRPLSIFSGYLSLFLQSHFVVESIVARSVGVSYPAINASDIRDISITIPPLSEQHDIVDRIREATSQIGALQTKNKQSITLLREYRSSLIHHAVTGKIDLRDYDAQVQ